MTHHHHHHTRGTCTPVKSPDLARTRTTLTNLSQTFRNPEHLFSLWTCLHLQFLQKMNCPLKEGGFNLTLKSNQIPVNAPQADKVQLAEALGILHRFTIPSQTLKLQPVRLAVMNCAQPTFANSSYLGNQVVNGNDWLISSTWTCLRILVGSSKKPC